MDYPLRPKCPTCDWERLVVPCADLFHGEDAVLVPAPQPEGTAREVELAWVLDKAEALIREHYGKGAAQCFTDAWGELPKELQTPAAVSPLVPAPPEPQQEYTTGYNGLLTPEESTARLEAMADESDRLASEAEKQDIRVNAKQDAIEWRLDAYAIREALRAAAARSPQPTEHQAFVAVMNALDIHMPPDGQNLLDELRKIAQTVGYPWRGLVAARSPTPAAQAWQPISTAPEATAVLVFLPNYGTITANRTDKIWWWNYGHGQVVYPTHWMPIPAPPVGSPAPAKEP